MHFSDMPTPSPVFDALIIGGGPAGCTAALWLHELGLSPCLIEARTALGGANADNPFATPWVPFLPKAATGQDLARLIDAHMRPLPLAQRLGSRVESLSRTAHGFAAALSNGEILHGRCAVLACGTAPFPGPFTPSPACLIGPGERIKSAVFTGQRVAVLGGGDNAFENALWIAEQGAAKVRLFTRRIRARRQFQQLIPDGMLWHGDYQADQAALTVNGEAFDRFVVLYGFAPVLPVLDDLDPERCDERGFLSVDGRCETSIPRLFAIGEINARQHPCNLTAMADGVVAAKAIQRLLEA